MKKITVLFLLIAIAVSCKQSEPGKEMAPYYIGYYYMDVKDGAKRLFMIIDQYENGFLYGKNKERGDLFEGEFLEENKVRFHIKRQLRNGKVAEEILIGTYVKEKEEVVLQSEVRTIALEVRKNPL